MKRIKHPHDLLFKKSFADINLAKEFFAIHLPVSIRSLIDLEQLELKDKTFIHPTLRKQEADILFAVPFLKLPGELYLLTEHLSTHLTRLPFRMLEQQIFIMGHNKNSEYLPVVRCIVYYTGDDPHLQRCHINQLFHPELQSFVNNMISPPIDLISVKYIPDEITTEKKYTALMEFAFKLPHRDNIKESMPILTELIHRAEKLGQIDLIAATIYYLLNTIDMDQNYFIETIFTPLKPEIGEKIMTIAERLRNEGFLEGIQQGIEQGIQKGKQEGLKTTVKNLLREAYSIQKIVEITALSKEQILEFEKY